jgi:trans-2-enoyl-CoA reductase
VLRQVWISFKISSAFGSDAATIGVFLKTTYSRRTASQVEISLRFEEAHKTGLYAKQTRCFFQELKNKTLDLIKLI